MSTTLLAFLARPGDAARPCADIAVAGRPWHAHPAAALAECAATGLMTMATIPTNQSQPAYAPFGSKRHGRRPSEVLIT